MTTKRSASQDYSPATLAAMSTEELIAERRMLLPVVVPPQGAAGVGAPAWMTRLYASQAVAILDAAIAAR